MEEKLRLIVADDEYLICGMLTKMIRYDELGLELIGTANNGESLWSMVEREKPDIVITDISMPGTDGLEVIRRAHERELSTKFVLISGYREFEYAYTALKYGVVEYILKPVAEQDLNAALSKALEQLRKPEPTADFEPARALFFKDSFLQELQREPRTLDDLNRSCGTRFAQGVFRMLKVKLDLCSGSGEGADAAFFTEGMLQAALKKHFSDCADCLIDTEQDGAAVLLNYPSAQSGEFLKHAAAMLSELKRESCIGDKLHITLCASTEYTDLSDSLRKKQEALDAAWSRLVRGVDRVLLYREVPCPVPKERQAELESRMTGALEILDGKELREATTEFFRLPTAFLESRAALELLRRCTDRFLSLHHERLSAMQDEANAQSLGSQIQNILSCGYPMAALRDELLSHLTAAMEELSERKDIRQSRAVRIACACVEREYGSNITLDHIAQQVDLSPDYFSRLFKEETGQNFIKYVTDVRIDHARELLRSSGMNVSEIACAVGFANVQYFSKIFKKSVGVKPTEYRNLYQ